MATMGHQTVIYIEPGSGAATWDSSSEAYEIISEGIKKTGLILDTSGISGTRSHAEERTKEGPYEVGGPLVINPSSADLDLWLPRIMGATEVATDTFNLAELLATNGTFAVNKELGLTVEQLEFLDCQVNSATFRASASNLLELELDIMGLSAVVGTTAPTHSPGIATNNDPYSWSEAVVTLASNAITCMDFEIKIDNVLKRRFSNSITATDLTAGDRIVTAKFTVPYSTANEKALYDIATAGISASVVFTNGTLSLTFTLGVLQVPPVTPVVNNKDEIVLLVEGVARSTGATKELVIVNDSVV